MDPQKGLDTACQDSRSGPLGVGAHAKHGYLQAADNLIASSTVLSYRFT